VNVPVDYTPSNIGLDTGALAIGSNDPDEPMVSVALSGTGIAAQVDVFLTRLRVPNSVHLAIPGNRDKRIVAVAEQNFGSPQEATVTLTVSGGGVTVPVPITQLVSPGDGGDQFKFDVNIQCTASVGSRTLTWAATIAAAQDSDLTNNTLTGSTEVFCRQ
jgi:hypothetical protein